MLSCQAGGKAGKRRSSYENICVINRYNGVTHNYEREGEYNLWFTLQVQSEDERDNVLKKISALPGVLDLMNLPSEKTYKVRVRFNMD